VKFDQNVEYKCPAWAYPLCDFHKICRFCTQFQVALDVKIWLNLLQGFRSYGGFKLRGSGFPQIFSAPSGEIVRQIPKSFRGARTCSRSSIAVPSLVRLGFHPPPGRPKMLSFLSVCLSVCFFVTLLNVRDCAPDFAMKALEYRNDFDAVGERQVCSCAPVFNFVRLLPIGDNTKCRSRKKRQKLGFFDNRGRQNKPFETKFGT